MASPNPADSPYLVYQIVEEYVTDSGKRALPVGRVGADAQAVNLHSAITYRDVRFRFVRARRVPVPPEPVPKAGEVLLSAVTSPVTPVTIGGGESASEITGHYRFAVLRTTNHPIAVNPHNTLSYAPAVKNLVQSP